MFKREGKETGNIFDRYDMFGTPIPSFNLEGTDRVGTSIGCIFSVIITVIVLSYSYTKGKIFVYKDKPLITTASLYDEGSYDYSL